MNKTWRKRLEWAALVLAAAAGLAYGFWPEAVPVDTAVIARGDVVATVEDEGISQVREVYLVSAPIAGTVKRSPVEIGDQVMKDKTVVASILPLVHGFLDERAMQMAEAEIKAADASLKLARANHDRAVTEADYWSKQLTRMEKLRLSAAVSERTVDETRMEANSKIAAEQSARAEIDLRTRELERAKAAVLNPPALYAAASARCCLTVMAPENGVVLKIQNESEAVVAAGAPLLEIGNPRDLEIVVELLSRDAVRVHPGARATVEAWGGAPLIARVRRVDSAGFTKISALGIEEQRVRVWLDLIDPPSRWEHLGHNYRIIARIVVDEAKNVLRVPVSAMFRRDNSWAVFLDRGNRAQLVPLVVGQKNFEWAEVKDGLKANDAVIIFPSDRLAEGVRIRSRKVSD